MTSRLCELTRWVVCFLGSTSTAAAASEACKLLISSCIAKMWGFALTRDFFKSSITCSFVFTRLASFWASLFGSRFFPLNQLPALHSALSVSRKAFSGRVQPAPRTEDQRQHQPNSTRAGKKSRPLPNALTVSSILL